MPCNAEKHIFAIYLFVVYMYVYRKVEDDLYVCLKTKTPSWYGMSIQPEAFAILLNKVINLIFST